MGTFCFVLAMLVCSLASNGARGDVTVYLNFNYQWRNHLDNATSGLGFTFTETERSQIESNILSQMQTMYQDFNVDFVTSAPSGDRHRINFGASTSSSTTYGSAPLDFKNLNPNQTQSVYVENFDGFLEASDTREKQIAEISTALAGTAAHELGHSLGLRHHDAYGTPEITPANYSATQNYQDKHIMATGATGLSESEREKERTFSQWSKLVLECATDLTDDPIAVGSEIGDAGNSTASAQSLALEYRPISELGAALVGGKITSTDVDYYSFYVPTDNALITAEIWSDDLPQLYDNFDTALTLFDKDGATALAYVNDTMYSGNTFNGGSTRETDSFLLNIPVATRGTYYIAVSSLGVISGGSVSDYNLLIGTTVPEIHTVGYVAIASFFGLTAIRLRRRSSPGT